MKNGVVEDSNHLNAVVDHIKPYNHECWGGGEHEMLGGGEHKMFCLQKVETEFV